MKRPPERLGDRFQVGAQIGAGASAITYRGWDERLERPVAIKILRANVALDPTYVRRFQQEARAAASVSHGNVVDVYDFGQQGDALYIVMQFIDGEDLKQVILREGALPLDRVRGITAQVLDGLRAIHAAGIIHRDIKPQNVLIGRDGIARLTDFGVAHVAEDSGLTTAGTTVGTAAYMAPEQAQAGRISEATDLYAVGVMLYEMLTGFLPFNAPTALAMMLQHIQESPVPPSQRLPGRGLPRWLDGIVLQALAKHPGDRFASAAAMKQALLAGDRGGDERQTTVALPAAQSQRTTALPRQQPVHRATAAVPSARPITPPRAQEREGAGLRSVLAGFLVLLLLAIAAGAGWLAYREWQDGQGTDLPPATAMATNEVVAPTAAPTDAPPEEPTEETIFIEPAQPTDEPTTAPTATIAPTETAVPSPTPEPTATEGPPTPTEEAPIIEPLNPTEEVGRADGAVIGAATGETYLFSLASIEEGFAGTIDTTPIDRLTVAPSGDQLVFAIEENGEVAEYSGVPTVRNGMLAMTEMRQSGGDGEPSVKPNELGRAMEDGINEYFASQGLSIAGVEVTGEGLMIQTAAA